ncbi:partner of Y14 and mago [Microdochium nivale]|nr:partner of Y14 and mago [Microdochium nivale]
MPSEPSKSGIVTDETSGDRHIPESVRADGSTRKAIKIRPGYRPPEDVELYKNRTAEGFRNRGKAGGGVIGAEGLTKAQPVETPAASAASNKNAKRREARKKAKDSDQTNSEAPGIDSVAAQQEEEVDPDIEREKKARNLRKKLKQARDLKNKKEGGEALLPEQIAKVIKINELVRELAALGFAEEEPTVSTNQATTEKPQDG